jgi:hypothetical protein
MVFGAGYLSDVVHCLLIVAKVTVFYVLFSFLAAPVQLLQRRKKEEDDGSGQSPGSSGGRLARTTKDPQHRPCESGKRTLIYNLGHPTVYCVYLQAVTSTPKVRSSRYHSVPPLLHLPAFSNNLIHMNAHQQMHHQAISRFRSSTSTPDPSKWPLSKQ